MEFVTVNMESDINKTVSIISVENNKQAKKSIKYLDSVIELQKSKKIDWKNNCNNFIQYADSVLRKKENSHSNINRKVGKLTLTNIERWILTEQRHPEGNNIKNQTYLDNILNKNWFFRNHVY